MAQPILRTSIDPPRVLVEQKTTLRLEVLAPNYLTKPPQLPEFQVCNAVTRRLQSLTTRPPAGHSGRPIAR